MPIIIHSDDQVANIERHFKVLAGPGAGKTRFIVGHIKNILNNSKRLKINRRIACITYTNVATESILKRVGNHGGRLEISTIHSFLYKHLVKPYVHLIASDYNLDAYSVDGHDDAVLTNYSTLKEWKEATNQRFLDDKDIIKAFSTLKWKMDASGDLYIAPRFPGKSGKYNFKTNSYIEYKKIAWSKGVLHHDDVLYFSFELLKKHPFLLTVIRAKFPYFLIDEFQDTSPIQINLLHQIAKQETIVGVVGDELQSIYKFLGAVPGQLKAFTLPDMDEYEIKDNWRSSDEIIELLNRIRSGMVQSGLRKEKKSQVCIVIGDKLACYTWARSQYPDEEFVTLCYENQTSNAIKKGIGVSFPSDLLKEFKEVDKSDRRRTVSHIIKSVEYARMGYFKDALRTILRLRKTKLIDDKRAALQHLKLLLDNHKTFSSGKLMDLYKFVNDNGIATLAGFKAGAPKTFYENTEYEHLASDVKNLYEAGEHRTIHKSKGDEFNSVLLILDKDKNGRFDEDKELSFLLKPNLENDEDHRVMYVALSRAEDNLFIAVPSLSAANISEMKNRNLRVETVP